MPQRDFELPLVPPFQQNLSDNPRGMEVVNLVGLFIALR
jgi:hypothetical protein